jgi:phage baseplate assembly protein W
MSYSLAVRNGDLQRLGDSLDVVWGIDKLKQDLQLWIAERFGGDRFHPELGSTLQDYIGSVISLRTKADIEDEVMRVLDNYQRVQIYGFKREPRRYSMAELLESIENIAISIQYDTISVAVSVRSAAQADARIAVTQGV